MRLALAALATLLLSCADDAGPHDVTVRVEVSDPDAARVSVRVWDERHELVRDDWRPADALPRALRLFPDDRDPTPVEQRWSRVEVELWTADGCPYARRVATYRYRGEPREEVLTVGATDAVGSRACLAAFVDPARGDDAGECLEGAPCATLERGLERVAEGGERRRVLLLAGGHEYPALDLPRSFGRRTLDDPSVLRAWPGLALPELPQIRARAGRGNALSLCCNFRLQSTGERVLLDFPEGVEIDGLDVEGGTRTGIELQGTQHVRVRNCYVHDAARFPDDEVSAEEPGLAGIRVHRSGDIVIEHNRIENNLDESGEFLVSGVFSGYRDAERVEDDAPVVLLDNRIVGNGAAGVSVIESDRDVILRGNTVCANRAEGVRVVTRFTAGPGDGGLTMDHNAVLGNALDGVLVMDWAGPIAVRRTTFSENGGASVRAESLPADARVEDSVVVTLTGQVTGDNDTLDAPLGAAECLLAPPSGVRGACADFPACAAD